jgi:hypothetical protein
MQPGQTIQPSTSQAAPPVLKSPPKLAADFTLAARLCAELTKKAIDGEPGYRRAYGNGLEGQEIKTREVSSWLQVPAILEELHTARKDGKAVDIRLLFPDVKGKDSDSIRATQVEIKEFFQAFHSKTAGDMYAALENKLTKSKETRNFKGFTVKDFLGQFENLKKENTSVLSVTDVVDLNGNSKAFKSKESLVATLLDAAAQAGDRKVVLLVDVPSKEAEQLAQTLRAADFDRSKLGAMRIWAGKFVAEAAPIRGKNLEELTIDDFLKRMSPAKESEDQHAPQVNKLVKRDEKLDDPRDDKDPDNDAPDNNPPVIPPDCNGGAAQSSEPQVGPEVQVEEQQYTFGKPDITEALKRFVASRNNMIADLTDPEERQAARRDLARIVRDLRARSVERQKILDETLSS